MLTIKEYKQQLKVADKELIKALRKNDYKRQAELIIYKSILKDDLIKLLEIAYSRIFISKVS